MTKLLKVTISGSYYSNSEDVENFSDVEGVMPMIADEKVSQMVIKRYARIWIPQAKDATTGMPLYKRIHRIREVYLDSIDEVEAPQLSYVGKDIMSMSFDELQDLAAAKDLSAVPLYKVGSLAIQRRRAFAEYSTKALNRPVDFNEEGFSPALYPAIVADGDIETHTAQVADVEETIDKETLGIKATPTDNTQLSLEQLKKIADMKNIKYHPNIGHRQLYDRVYPKTA